MKIDLLSTTKKQNIDISDSAFGRDFNESLVHQAVVSYMAGSRQGTSQQKTRSDVRKQKASRHISKAFKPC